MPWYSKKRKKRASRCTRLPVAFLSTIVGYDEVKDLFRRSIRAKKPTNILMTGPPASAKSAILLECSRLPYSMYVLGGRTTKAGLSWALIEHKPNYLLIDEIDKMKSTDLVVLLSLMETGLIKVIKHKHEESAKLSTRVYAACNAKEALPPELLSRFQFKLHFKAYTEEEFTMVANNVLTKLEETSPRLASYIVSRVGKYSRDVRDCIGIARLARTDEDVDKLIKVQRKYSRRDWYGN